jgi:NAD(P)H-dependent FMN reductase
MARSLADDLRQRDDDALRALLRARPDLLHPVPGDFTALTSRATAGPSVSRCLDGLDALHLFVLRCAAECSVEATADAGAIVAAVGLPIEAGDAVRGALDDVQALGLVYGDSAGLRAVSAIRELVGGAQAPHWPPPITGAGTAHDPADVDAQAALHAREQLALVRDLLDDWSVHPPGVLRSGALSLRDFAAARGALHSDWQRASLTIEIAHAAMLLADDEDETPHWLPTDHYDTWLGASLADQWRGLVDAWLDLPRLPSLADERTQVLSHERDRRAIPVLRRDVLTLLASMPPGTSLSDDVIAAILDDHQPRRSGELRALTIAATLREGTDLGVLTHGALSTAGRSVLAPHEPTTAGRTARAHAIAGALEAALPDDVDHVLIQADLTIVAPGPLASSVARSLRLLADVESRGHATVYRVTESSIRRALDAGWDAHSVHELLTRISRTPVPQPLTYMVDDVARRHGAVRVGHALGYIRSDNVDVLAAIAADRRLKSLGLHRIADTVVVAQVPTSELLIALRNAGYAPAAEAPDGTVVIRRPEDRRTRITARRSAAVTTRRTTEGKLLDAAIRTLRAGDRASGPRSAAVTGPAASVDMPKQSAAAVVAELRRAIADTCAVWIGYADTDGTVQQQIVDPIRLNAGVLTAFDHRTDTVRTFGVSRITGVADESSG